MSQTTQTLIADGQPATIAQTTEAYGETYLTLEHAETGEELGTVTESEVSN